MTVSRSSGHREDGRCPAADRVARRCSTTPRPPPLAELGVRIEQRYGAPQDVEWARAGGDVLRSCRPGRSRRCPSPRRRRRRTGRCPTRRRSTSARASSSSCPTRCRRCSRAGRRVGHPVAAGADAASCWRRSDVIRSGDIALPTVNGYAYYRYSRRGDGADDAGLVPGVPGTAAPRPGEPAGPVAGAGAPAVRPGRGARDGAAVRRPHRTPSCSTTLRRCSTPAPRYYTAVQTIIPLAATSEMIVHAVLRAARAPGGRAARVHVPARASTARRSGPRSRSTTSPPGPGRIPRSPMRCAPRHRTPRSRRSTPTRRLPE